MRWKVFGFLWILVVLNYIDRAALSIALPFISKDFDLTPELQGVLLGCFFYTYLVFQIPGGVLLDKLGARKVILAAGALWGVFQALGGFASSGVALILLRLGLGAAEAPISPSSAKLNSAWLPAKERARGATFVDAASPFGAAVGGLAVTALIGVFGSWREAFVITGVLTVIISIVFYLYLRDTPEQHKAVSPSEIEYIRGEEDVADAIDDRLLPKVSDYVRSRSFWAMMFGRLGWATVWWGIISWTPTYLSEAMHFDLGALGWGTFAVYGMGVLGQLVAGYTVDKWRSATTRYNLVMKTVFGISGLGTAVAVFSLPAISNGYTAVVALGIAVFFINFGGLYWAIPAWLAPKQQVGRIGGVMNVASSGGGGLAPVVMGFAIAASAGSFAGSFVFLGISATVYLVGSLLINYERPLAHARQDRLDADRPEERATAR
ncbi:hypothetical protein ASF23_07400 [Curtobacterium sp. Leaf261]|nr:hypothetical protein ASF23_07400 [Curtobacterium sp. Leaf261]